ncbi:MAG: hypothetical protein JXR63_03640 [Spirochaetales bacterium]|nr:hypothetical protein [Spirochaetales bacterium]
MGSKAKSDEQKRFSKSLIISISMHIALLLLVLLLNLVFGLFEKEPEPVGARIVLVTADYLGSISEKKEESEKNNVEQEEESPSTELASQKSDTPADIPVSKPKEPTVEAKPKSEPKPTSKPESAKPDSKSQTKPEPKKDSSKTEQQSSPSTDLSSLFQTDSTPTTETEYLSVDESSPKSDTQSPKKPTTEESLFTSDQLDALSKGSSESDNQKSSGGEASSSQTGSPDYSEVPISLADLQKSRTILKKSDFDLSGLDLGGRKFITVVVEIVVQANGFVSSAKVTTTGNSEADRRIETTLTSKWLFSPVQGAKEQKYKVAIRINLI